MAGAAVSGQPPRPNPAIYPRALTRVGHKVHRMRRHGAFGWVSLCGRVSNYLYQVGIEGQKPNRLFSLVEFDAESAADLDPCRQCTEKAGRFA